MAYGLSLTGFTLTNIFAVVDLLPTSVAVILNCVSPFLLSRKFNLSESL